MKGYKYRNALVQIIRNFINYILIKLFNNQFVRRNSHGKAISLLLPWMYPN